MLKADWEELILGERPPTDFIFRCSVFGSIGAARLQRKSLTRITPLPHLSKR
jgi:hypothetical protein